MADNDSTADTDGAQAAATADATAQAATDGTQDGAADDTGTLSVEDARKLRSESQALRKRLRDAEAELEKRQDADLTERQKLERDNATVVAAKSQVETENRMLRAQIAASKAGVKPDMVDLVPGALDWAAIEQSDDPKALEKAIKELLKDRPSLGSPVDLDGGTGRGANGRTDSLTDLLLAKTGR